MTKQSISTEQHRKVIFLLILIWAAYQKMLADGVYKRLVRQHARINLMTGAFHEKTFSH